MALCDVTADQENQVFAGDPHSAGRHLGRKDPGIVAAQPPFPDVRVGIGQLGDPFEGIAGRFGILDFRYRLMEELVFGVSEEVAGRRIDLRDEKRGGRRIPAQDAGAIGQFVRKSVQEPGFDSREEAPALLADKAGNQFTQAGGQPAFFGREAGMHGCREIGQDKKTDSVLVQGENDQAAVFVRDPGEDIPFPGAGFREEFGRGLKRRARSRDGRKEFVVEGMAVS